MYRIVGPILRSLDPELAHGLTLSALKTGLAPCPAAFEDPALHTRALGLEFANPIGLAAGFDKNAEVTDAVRKLGFGFTEIGSVTPRPQKGNPRPRLFRLTSDGAVINRMGFNNDGLEVVAARLARRRGDGVAGGVIGVNLGKNKHSGDAAADYVAGARVMADLADYLVVNVSSPNTPGLRALQSRDQLKSLLEAVMAALSKTESKPPLLLKIAPDLTDEDKSGIAEAVLETGVAGLIATNTTIARPSTLSDRRSQEAGGLSGRPLFDSSTRVLADMHRLTGGKIPLIGAGGVDGAEAAYAKIRAGASLVQLYTALIYHGPGLVNDIKRGLVKLLQDDGFSCIAEAVGADHN
ncbi:MAG TPA: quinone-dependent dihydroorotate dehydrogenase [Rhodospirillales bacterium]|nr:quinone-dependent dihydroorotate dehydrogenase [Rhodospirillales bacterium]